MKAPGPAADPSPRDTRLLASIASGALILDRAETARQQHACAIIGEPCNLSLYRVAP